MISFDYDAPGWKCPNPREWRSYSLLVTSAVLLRSSPGGASVGLRG